MNSQSENNGVEQRNKPKYQRKKEPTDKSSSTSSSATVPLSSATQHQATATSPIVSQTQAQSELSDVVDDNLPIIGFHPQEQLPTSVVRKLNHDDFSQCHMCECPCTEKLDCISPPQKINNHTNITVVQKILTARDLKSLALKDHPRLLILARNHIPSTASCPVLLCPKHNF